jgi:hypothetical protein
MPKAKKLVRNPFPPKDYVQERKYVCDSYEVEGPLEDSLTTFCARMRETAKGLVRAEVAIEVDYESYGGPDFYVKGWRPLNDAEKVKRKRQRERAKSAAQKRKDTKFKKDLKQIHKLAKKYPNVVKVLDEEGAE